MTKSRLHPPKRPVYLKLHFAPGECAQVDWGAYRMAAGGDCCGLR